MKTVFSGMLILLLCIPGAGWTQGNSPDDRSEAERDTAVRTSVEDREMQRAPKAVTHRVTPMVGQELIHHLEAYQMELIRAQGAKVPPRPIPLSSEADAQLAQEGVLSSVGEQANDTNAPRGGQTVSLRFDNAPLEQVTMLYFDLTGKKVEVEAGVYAAVTLRTQEDLTKGETVRLVETALRAQNVGLFPAATNTLVARWIEPSLRLQRIPFDRSGVTSSATNGHVQQSYKSRRVERENNRRELKAREE